MELFYKEKEDVILNLDKFISGENKILFIVGNVGAGKSSVACELAAKIEDCIYVQMDLIRLMLETGQYKTNNTKYESKIIKDYDLINLFNKNNKDYLKTNIEFTKQLTNYNGDQKIIIDGLSLAKVLKNKKDIQNLSIYIKGTKLLKSFKRAIYRLEENKLKNFIQMIVNIKRFLELNNAQTTKKFIKNVKKLAS